MERGSVAHNLPLQLTSFIGRVGETADVKRLLPTTRLLTLTGPGGCGKTRFALHVAADVVDAYKDGVWVVELAPLFDPTLVPHTVAAVLGVREEPHRPLLATLTDALHTRHLLLVLDNCEHLVAACAVLADALLRACAHLQILATSREVLSITGETTWPVPSLSTPDPQCALPLDHLMQYEAVRLFVERATAMQPTFTVTHQQAPWVAQICHRLDGTPLALELAATRVKVLSVEQIAMRLDDRFRLLTGGSRTALPRQQTLHATMDWSYDLLSEPERSVWRRLSVFAGGWTLAAAERVCAGPDVDAAAVLNLLSSLVDKSLVMVAEQAGQARYHMLETIRQYGAEKLRETGETAVVQQRHRDWYLGLAEQAAPGLLGVDESAWLERLETEYDNLRAALAWSMEQVSAAAVGVRFGVAVWRFWAVRGHWREGRQWLEAALSGSAGTSPSVRAQALYGAGRLAEWQDDYASARMFFAESLGLWQALGDKAGIATALNQLGTLALFCGEYIVALPLFEESLALRRALGARWGIAESLYYLGRVVACQGDYGLGHTLIEESLALWRALGYTSGIAESLAGLGMVAYHQGEYSVARALHEESLALRRALGAKWGIASSLNDLGRVASAQEDYVSARALYEESLGLCRALGDEICAASSLSGLGAVAFCQGDYTSAHTLAAESLALRRDLGDKSGIAQCLEALAQVAWAQEQLQRAATVYGAAEALREAIGAPLLSPGRARYDCTVAAVRTALDAEACATAWAAGRAMTLEQAMGYALTSA